MVVAGALAVERHHAALEPDRMWHAGHQIDHPLDPDLRHQPRRERRRDRPCRAWRCRQIDGDAGWLSARDRAHAARDRGEADGVGAKEFAGAFDIRRICFSRRLRLALGAFAKHGVGIEEAFFAVLRRFEQIGGEIGDIPGGVAQGVVAVLKALYLSEFRQVGEIRFEELPRAGGAHVIVPHRSVEHVIFLIEALKLFGYFKAGLGVYGLLADATFARTITRLHAS